MYFFYIPQISSRSTVSANFHETQQPFFNKDGVVQGAWTCKCATSSNQFFGFNYGFGCGGGMLHHIISHIHQKSQLLPLLSIHIICSWHSLSTPKFINTVSLLKNAMKIHGKYTGQQRIDRQMDDNIVWILSKKCMSRLCTQTKKNPSGRVLYQFQIVKSVFSCMRMYEPFLAKLMDNIQVRC